MSTSTTQKRAAEILQTNTEHLIFEGASEQKKLLIVFAYINHPLGARTHSNSLKDIDCKKLFLNPGVSEWYQTGIEGVAPSYKGVLAFLREVAAEYGDHEILCIGHSMGAYPALGMGVELGASRIFASVPEIVLNLPGSLSRDFLRDTDVQCGDLTEVLASNTKSSITVIVGKQTPFDLAVSQELAELPLVEVIELNSGHSTIQYMQEANKLHQTFNAFVAGGELRPILAGL